MSGDVWSELLLAAVTLGIAWRDIAKRPGVAIGMGLIGLTAALGALFFAGIMAATGPYQFAKLLAACTGLPLLAAGLRWQDGPLATRRTAAARFTLVVGAIGVLLVAMLHFSLWSTIAPAAAALLIMFTALQTRQSIAIAGGALLIACFALSAGNWNIAPLSAAQQFHLLMAIALALLGYRGVEKISA